MLPLIRPEWSPVGVRAFSTTRAGGVSRGPWAGLNLGTACGDEPEAVAENRRRLGQLLPARPCWLRQVHGTRVLGPGQWRPGIEADAAWTDRPGEVVAVLTADCLPVLITGGGVAGAAHAGWRGLCAGVLERLIESMPAPAGALQAWIGPGIGADAFEVGPEVRQAFLALDARLGRHFRAGRADRWLADLKGIAADRLAAAGLSRVFDCGLCTHADPARFFSYRRDRICGRMATLIWLD